MRVLTRLSILLVISVSSSTAISQRPKPAAIFWGIKMAAQKEARSGSPWIAKPKFTVGPTARQLTIVKGDVSKLEFNGDPYEMAFRKQMLIEALRLALRDTFLEPKKKVTPRSVAKIELRTSAEPYLAKAERLVREIVNVIESERNTDLLSGKLGTLETEIDDILHDKIYSAVEQAAERNGYAFTYGRGGSGIKKFPVNITTVPDGAKVFVMMALVHQKQLFTKTNPAQWPWVEIVQNPYPLLGKYRYLAIWPNGKRAEGTIDVTSASPLRFLPN